MIYDEYEIMDAWREDSIAATRMEKANEREARRVEFRDWARTTPELPLSGEQEKARAAVLEWLKRPDGAPVFRIFGYAGVGKSYLAREIARSCGGTVIFAAYTGKAANVLRAKGCIGAQTIHSLIYRPISYTTKEIESLRSMVKTLPDGERRERLRAELAEAERGGGTRFVLDREGSDLVIADLLIVDEVSMVDGKVTADLLSFGVPILVLGDPEQLPPINGVGELMGVEPDIMLTEVHRQAEGSPVIRLATEVRATGRIPRSAKTGVSLASLPIAAPVLVGRNSTRWAVIRQLRMMRGRSLTDPGPSDRIIILKNNRELNVFNGQQFIVGSVVAVYPHMFVLRVLDDAPGAVLRDLPVYRSGFLDIEGEREAGKKGFRGKIAAATWAESLTAHRAQGSEWDTVAIIDESAVFGRDDPRTPGRWAYTCVTRASQTLMIGDWYS